MRVMAVTGVSPTERDADGSGSMIRSIALMTMSFRRHRAMVVWLVVIGLTAWGAFHVDHLVLMAKAVLTVVAVFFAAISFWAFLFHLRRRLLWIENLLFGLTIGGFAVLLWI